MRHLRTFLCFSLTLFSSSVLAGEATPKKAKHNYQSDVARLRKIVINSLYSHSDIFIRELISNANDALEKFRLTALTNEGMWNGDPLNATIKAIKDEDGKGGRLVITDTGIGMSPEELTTNLGTLAKSGTSDFLARAEGSDGVGTGNLIGAFGLGFYSSFLVADRVEVASIPPKSEAVPEPAQYIFSSSADDNSFEVYPDPRGNTLGHGTEVTLYMKPDALNYLETSELNSLITKHSSFSTQFPLYVWDTRVEEVPDEEAQEETELEPESEGEEQDDGVAIIEDVPEDEKEKKPVKTKKVVVWDWMRINDNPPIWARDPKNVTESDYKLFYNYFWRDWTTLPLTWDHFSADSGSGIAFKALLYLPNRLPNDFWQQPLQYKTKDVRLMVKRVFITSDFGKFSLPQWTSYIKAVIDADDLPLNVSRETLQSTGFMKKLKGILVRHILQLFNKLADDPEKFNEIQDVYGSVFKFGAVEDSKNREKLTALCRFTTTQRNYTSLDQYLENKKQGQKQIFYLAEMGKRPEELAKSVFIEKLHARGYEVLLMTDPLDEILINHIREWKKIPFQDVAKAGLQFGDEGEDDDEEEEEKRATEKFQPLLDWLKNETKDIVRDVVISNRLVTSPCAIVADKMGYTGNVHRMLAASGGTANKRGFNESAIGARILEVNPRSPLIEGLLRRVEDLPSDGEEEDLEATQEMKEITSILIDGALVRSGFHVPDTNEFFVRVDRVLRRALGVSETAPTDDTVRPAPPVDPTLPSEKDEVPAGGSDARGDGGPGVIIPDHLKDKIQIDMEELMDDEFPELKHDEL